MECADYTAWGPDKDISRSAVCTQSVVTIKDGQTTKNEVMETLSWVETQKFYFTVLGEAELTIWKEVAASDTVSGTASGSQSTGAQAGSGASSGVATGTGQSPSTSMQAAGVAQATVVVNAVAFAAAAALVV